MSGPFLIFLRRARERVPDGRLPRTRRAHRSARRPTTARPGSVNYCACAQVRNTGNSATGMPNTDVGIPGVYKLADGPVNFSVCGRSTLSSKEPSTVLMDEIRRSIGAVSAEPTPYGGRYSSQDPR
ncbi:hypothetical protein CTA2_9577 [Colletotrichum tanaceti]|uniref:Uncharacterized protein n=1 Tax=Colletotrichum tanaceti TaxID=1306861 RepID=A0A4U6X9Y3_9PEZI|nr:hypothetical protein CTA2_9577 [Colletotrichum tanaceti]TKW50467.1 hypothetical protein CTA1_4280 [Colletotrichum tanaceti]